MLLGTTKDSLDALLETLRLRKARVADSSAIVQRAVTRPRAKLNPEKDVLDAVFLEAARNCVFVVLRIVSTERRRANVGKDRDTMRCEERDELAQ
jgi:hypothetical protein